MLRNRVFYLALLLMAALIYIFTNTYYTLTLFLVVIALPVVSCALMMVSRRRVAIAMDIPASMTKENTKFFVQVENKSMLPIARAAFDVALENQLTGSKVTRKVYASAGGKGKFNTGVAIENPKAGATVIEVKNLRIQDSFGLFSFKTTGPTPETTIVYPNMRGLEVFMEKPVETTGEGSRYSPYKKGFDVSEIFALREYAAGDEVRKIHWKLSSKVDKTMVRDFSLPLNYSLSLLIELTACNEEVMDKAVELYLSLSWALLEQGINHNLAWYDSGEGEFHLRELDDFEDLEMATMQMLSAYCYEEKGLALDYYGASSYRNPATTLLYVATDADSDKVAEMEVIQPMKTISIDADQEDLSELWV